MQGHIIVATLASVTAALAACVTSGMTNVQAAATAAAAVQVWRQARVIMSLHVMTLPHARQPCGQV